MIDQNLSICIGLDYGIILLGKYLQLQRNVQRSEIKMICIGLKSLYVSMLLVNVTITLNVTLLKS